VPTDYPVIQSGAANELGGSFSIQTDNKKFGTGSLLASAKPANNLSYANSNFITNGTDTRIRVQFASVYVSGHYEYTSSATQTYSNIAPTGWREYKNNISSLFTSGYLTTFGRTQYVNGLFVIPVTHNTEGNKWLTSTDGLTWIKVANQLYQAGNLFFANNRYWATGLTNNTLFYSSTLSGTWSPAPGLPTGGGYGQYAQFINVGTTIIIMAIVVSGGSSFLYEYRSTDNSSFAGRYIPQEVFPFNQIAPNGSLSVNLRHFVVCNGVLILTDSVGSNGRIYYKSASGSINDPWTKSNQTFNGYYHSLIVIGNTAYLIDDYKIRTSTNGNTWTEIADTPSANLEYYGGVIYDNIGWTAGASSYGYSSTDAITWTTHEASYYVSNSTPANINYTSATWWNTWQTFDFWIYITANTTSTNLTPNLFVAENPVDFSAQLYITRSGAGNNAISMMGLFTGLVIASNTWTHIRFSRKRSDNTQSLYVDGTRVDTQAYTYTGGDSGGFIIGYADNTYAYPTWSLDELLISNNLITDPATTSFSPPTQAWDTGANLLLHFDTDTQYQTQSTTKNATANLSATTSITITADKYKIVSASANLQVSTQLTANNQRIKNANSSVVVNTTLTTNSNRISNINATLTAQFSQTATISDIRGVDMRAFANASLSVAVRRIRTTNIQVSSAYSITASATSIRRASSNPVSASSISANPVRRASARAALSAAFSLVLDEYTRAHLRSTTSLTATAIKTSRAQANLSATSTCRLIYITLDLSIVWTIPADKINWKIEQETNNWLVPQDITMHIIEKEDYGWTIQPQEITYTI
jgi:hypothetical protein